MKSFIILELIANYKNKYKYDDFDFVTRTIIRRKAIDFSSNHRKRNQNLTYGPSDRSTGESGEDNLNLHFLDLSVQNHEDQERNQSAVDTVIYLQHQINNYPNRVYFSDWDRDFVDMVVDLFKSGCDLDKDDLLACMGFEPNEMHKLNVKLNLFRNKIKKHLHLDQRKPEDAKDRLQCDEGSDVSGVSETDF
jgi:hypothetical protein